MRTPILLAALLLTPLAAAWPWDPVTIEAAHSRVGDRVSWEVVHTGPDGATRVDTVVLLVEAIGRSRDRFATERDVETFRIDRYEGGEWVWAERCHAIRGGDDAVRRDFLHGEPIRTSPAFGLGSVGFEGSFQVHNRDVASFSEDRCEPRNPIGGATFTEGRSETLGRILPGEFAPHDPLAGILSEPAQATRWEGRNALAFTFDIREFVRQFAPDSAPLGDVVGSARFVVADGLPGFAEWSYQATTWSDDLAPGVVSESWRLAGFEAAPPEAPPLSAWSGAVVPRSLPADRLRPVDRTVFDDSPFGLPFRYHEAWESARTDPTTGLAAFLARNPDAFLQAAAFELGARDPDAAVLASDGSWTIVVCGATECHGVRSFRVSISAQPPVKAIRHHVESHLPDPAPLPPGERLSLVDTATADRILRGLGEPFGDWGTILYAAGYGNGWDSPDVPWAGIIVSDVAAKDPTRGNQDGRGAWFDLTRGRVGSVFEQNVEQSDGIAAGVVALRRPASLAATHAVDRAPLAIPDGAALAVGAAAGLGLLVLAIKALWALFTRLAPSDVLTNPRRAALFARIRGEPGIHRARLIAGSGAGNGATRHHLSQLVRHKLVFATEEGGYVRYFAAGDVDPARAARESVLRAGRHREVYDLFAARPNATLREAAALLGMSAPSVFRAKRKLAKAGLLPVPDSVEATRIEV